MRPRGRRSVALRPPQGRDDAGSETVEIVIIVPVLMLLVVAGLQMAMWALSAHALSLAVAEGGAEARAQLGTGTAAAAVVTGDVKALAGPMVGSLRVVVRRLPDDFVSLSAKGTVPSIVPGVRIEVSSTSAGPAQGFRASG